MNDNISDKLITRMKALLAMSNDKGSEHEALIATKRLHVMLAKHNISMCDLNDTGTESIEQDFETYDDRPWKRIVANKIAELYFCEFYRVKGTGRKSEYFFIGTTANRIFAIHILNLIVKIIEKEARIESRKVYGKENCGFVNSFWFGAKERIVERCNELISRAKEGSLVDEDGTSLPALLSIYDHSNILNKLWVKNNDSLNLISRTNRLGRAAGEDAGNKVQLSRSLHRSSAPKLLGN